MTAGEINNDRPLSGFYAGVSRANGNTLWFVEITFTFHAFIGVDLINFVTDRDGGSGAFGFTGSAVDTFFIDD